MEKMKIVEINGTNYSSTGNIMLNIAKQARKQGFEVFTCCKNSRKSQQFKYDNQIIIGSRYERLISEQLAAISGLSGSFNYFSTKSFIKKLEEIKPDLVHLHIMHDTYINLNILFNYLSKNNIPVIWTFHDCWAFTGKCPYFEIDNCDKWKNGCYDCPQIRKYPESYLFDKSKYLWNKKNKLFNSINNLTIVTPSMWLANYAKESFLKNHDIRVINNGINLNIFKPTDSDFRIKNNIENKFLILGVGYNWSPRKGLDSFIELSMRLDDRFKIILVGTNDKIDESLPKNIISIHRTYNQEELVKIYSACDLFVNPTLEDNFPTVNIESLACGTPVLTYKTGGSPEIIDDKCGSVVQKGNIDSLEKEIIRIYKEKPYSRQDCINRAKCFNAEDRFDDYVKLYKEVLSK